MRPQIEILKSMILNKVNCPLTSSVGRLFDAVSSLVRIRDKITYEGQAAIELEMAMEENQKSNIKNQKYKYAIGKRGAVFIIDPKDIFVGIVEDLRQFVPRGIISFKFHNTIVEIIVDMCKRIREETGLCEVVLSGGVFQNMFLLHNTVSKLRGSGFNVYTHHRVPTNDGSISLGQAVIANNLVN